MKTKGRTIDEMLADMKKPAKKAIPQVIEIHMDFQVWGI